MMWGPMWNFGSVGWGWMIFGWLFMVLFWGAVVWLIWWAIARSTQDQRTTGGQSPLDIAKTRYARGEITREQYEQLKRDLT